MVKGNSKLNIPATHKCGNQFLDELNTELKDHLGNFFKIVQDVSVNQVNSDNALNDVERSELLAPYFTEKHWPENELKWEFIDINIPKITNNLRKHFDYKNDQRKDYNDATIYSEIIHCG